MLFVLLLSFAVCEKIKIVYGNESNLVLSIVQMVNGGKRVRLMDSSKPTNNVFNTFEITEGKTNLVNTLGIICAKQEDPGVIVCGGDQSNSKVDFVPKGEFVNIKFKNGKCLKKSSYDNTAKGFYANQGNCDGSPEQQFKIQKIYSEPEDTEPYIPCEMD